MEPEQRLGLQSMPDELMNLAKDQFGPHFIQFEIWVGRVIDAAFACGKAQAIKEMLDENAAFASRKGPSPHAAQEPKEDK